MVLENVIWMPREEAETMVRNRVVTRIDGKAPVAIGLHPEDTRLACLLLVAPTDRDPLPIYSGVSMYMLGSCDFD